MEARNLLAITVNTLVDENDGIGVGGISLRDALAAIIPGDTINFSVTGTLALSNLGQLSVNKSVTIAGPGADRLVISAYDPTPSANNGDGSRVFLIDDGTSNRLDVTITGLTLTNGDSNASGGAIFATENVTVERAVISGNASTSTAFATGGGAIYSSGGALTVRDSLLRDNLSGNEGGAIRQRFGSLVVERSSFRNNYATTVGGGISAADGNVSVQVVDSMLAGNASGGGGGGGGGGLFLYDARVEIINSTISGNNATWNSTTGKGGGILNWNSTLKIRYSTITANTADTVGGALYLAGGETLVEHSIIAENFHTGGILDDVSGPVMLRYCLLGVDSGAVITDQGGNQIGTSAVPIDPQLSPLADHGGPTWTHAPLSTSPAIDRGDPSAVPGVGLVPLHDQRGIPFTRVFGGRIDLGAVESQVLTPASFVVDTLIDEDDGDYSLGDRSLREVIALAEGSEGVETITFSPALTTSGFESIFLTKGELEIQSSMIVQGPGPYRLSITAQENDPTPSTGNGDGSRVFKIVDVIPGATLDVEIQGLTLSGGDVSGPGGAIYTLENLTVANCLIINNVTTSGGIEGGGAIYSGFEEGGGGPSSLTVRDSELAMNVAVNSEGGAIRKRFGTLTIERSTLSNNVAGTVGGAVSAADGAIVVAITDSTVNGNSTLVGQGGGLFFYVASVAITNTTVSDNQTVGSSAGQGGGISSVNSALHVSHSTIASNLAAAAGGGIQVVGTSAFIDQSIVANNVGAGPARDDIVGPVQLLFSLLGVDAGAIITDLGGNQIGTLASSIDPMLGPLTDHGGPTKTREPQAGSPALDAGDPNFVPPPDFDQRGAPYVRKSNGRIDLGAFEVQVPSNPCDLDGDGFCNGVDIDALVAAIAGGANPPAFDLTGDALVNLDDRDAWLADAGGVNLGPGRVYRLGDANLDSFVDGSDFNAWNANKFTSVAAWTRGDFSADGVVDGSDFNVWNANKFQSADSHRRAPRVRRTAPRGAVLVACPSSLLEKNDLDVVAWSPGRAK